MEPWPDNDDAFVLTRMIACARSLRGLAWEWHREGNNKLAKAAYAHAWGAVHEARRRRAKLASKTQVAA